MEATPQQTEAVKWTPDQRKTELAKRTQHAIVGGWKIESQTDYTAALVKGHRPNHILHLILTILTAGLWAIVWIILTITNKEHRRLLNIDEYGRVAG